MNRHTYRDRWPDDYDDYEDSLPHGKSECPECGDIVPDDHLDTDSGNCIGCEDNAETERHEAEVLAAPYALCLTGLQPKKRRRA